MSGLVFYPNTNFNAPGSVSRIQNRSNGVSTAVMAMPAKFTPSVFGSMFSSARKAYIKDAGGISGNQTVPDSSSRTQKLRLQAIGQSSTKSGLADNAALTFKNVTRQTVNDARRKCRNGGCVAPAKKGAIANTFRSGGDSILTGTGNRVIIAP